MMIRKLFQALVLYSLMLGTNFIQMILTFMKKPSARRRSGVKRRLHPSELEAVTCSLLPVRMETQPVVRPSVSLNDETELELELLETSQPVITSVPPGRAQLVKDSIAMPASVARLVEVSHQITVVEMIRTLLPHVAVEMMHAEGSARDVVTLGGALMEVVRPEIDLAGMAVVEERTQTQRNLLQGVLMLMQLPTARAVNPLLGSAFLETLNLREWWPT